MSNYLVEPPAGGWKDWKKLAEEAKIRFAQRQLELAEVLIGRSEFPAEKPQVILMDQFCGVSSVGRLLEFPYDGWSVPLHPIVLMALALGMDWDWATDDRVFRHMPYAMAMSPFLLAHADGKVFIFLLKRDVGGLCGEFMDLSKGDGLPRCMHVWGYKGERGRNEQRFVFHREPDGKYGRFVTCHD